MRASWGQCPRSQDLTVDLRMAFDWAVGQPDPQLSLRGN